MLLQLLIGYELKLLELLPNLFLQSDVGHGEECQAEDRLEYSCFDAGTLKVDLAKTAIRIERVFKNRLPEIDQKSLFVAELAVHLAILAELGYLLDLPLALL